MIRVGIGGWTYAPWRGTFYPKGLRQADELAHASRQLATIEINGTFYRSQSPESFARWRETVPDGFVFAVKGHKAIVTRRRLAEAGDSLDWFMASGVLELGDALGPFLWEIPPTRQFDPDDLDVFLGLLPRQAGGRALRHVVEVRHESFLVPEFAALLRRHGVAVATVDADERPLIGDLTADFAYARLQRTRERVETGYPEAELAQWAARAKAWEAGETPAELPLLGDAAPARGRDVFVYFIAGAKQRAPAAALALRDRLGR